MFKFDLTRTFGRVRMRGVNRLDFVQRMSTGDLLDLQPGQGHTTVFTTPIGRIIDHTTVLALGDSLLLLTGGGSQNKLLRWLRKYILFNDDVQLSDESAVVAMAGVFGEGAGAFADGLCPGASQWARYTHQAAGDILLVSAPPLQGAGYYLIGSSFPPSDFQTPIPAYDDLRIRAGYPAFPNEVNESFIPLEAGLIGAVSFTKGCYIGQEIIARMESRGQVAKRLVRIECDGSGAIKAGDSIAVDGKPVGNVTSVTSDFRAAMGYVRTPLAQEGQSLVIGSDNVAARVAGMASL